MRQYWWMVEGKKPPGLEPHRFVVGGRTAFGRPGPIEYRVPEDTTPVQMAAAAAQHRLIAEFRRQALDSHHFSRTTLGMSASSFERLVDGRKEATMVDLLAIAAAVGLEILDQLRPDEATFIPAGVRALEHGWSAGTWSLPNFAPSPQRLEEVDWTAVAEAVTGLVKDGQERRTLHALEGAGLTGGVLDALIRQGIDPGLAAPTRDSEFELPGLVLDLPHVAVVGVAIEVVRGSREAALQSLRRIVTLLHGLSGADERFAVLVVSQDISNRLDRLAAGVATAVAGDRVDLPFSTARPSLPAEAEFADLELSVRAALTVSTDRVLVLHVDKARDVA
jgi:hypothetical protein